MICIELSGRGDEVPKSGSVLFKHGMMSLSFGLCRVIEKAMPGVTGFNVKIILTPKKRIVLTPKKEKQNDLP
jgi:hypothetical protein